MWRIRTSPLDNANAGTPQGGCVAASPVAMPNAVFQLTVPSEPISARDASACKRMPTKKNAVRDSWYGMMSLGFNWQHTALEMGRIASFFTSFSRAHAQT